MILSLGEAIPRGRFFPLGLGIYIRRFGFGLSLSARSFSEVFSNHSDVIPSRVSWFVPLTIFPGLDLMTS
jgi:hypothetical protein